MERRTSAVWGVTLAWCTLHYAASALIPDVLWGAHHAAFLGAWVLPAVLAAALILATPASARATTRALSPLESTEIKAASAWAYGVTAALAAILFASLQPRHRLFGDNIPRLKEVEGITPVRGGHEYDTWLRHELHSSFEPFFGQSAEQTYASLSIAFGVLFAVAALGLARHVGRSRAEAAILFGCLSSSGFILLFCGYLESYNSTTAATLFFLWATVAYAGRRCSLWVPALALALTGLSHALGLIAAPALVHAFVVSRGLDARLPERIARWLGPAISLVSVAAGVIALRQLRPYSLLPIFEPRSDTVYTVLSLAHLLDLINEHLLVAMSGWLALTLAWLCATKRPARDPIQEVLGVAAASSVGMFAFIRPALGSLDWDLMALPAPAFVAYGGYYLIARTRDLVAFGAVRLTAVALGILHTAPWIALQQSEASAIAAIEAMTARDAHTIGRRGGTLGVLMLLEGHEEAGRRQLERNERVSPRDDPVALRSLGQVYLREGRYDEVEELLPRMLLPVPDRGVVRLVRAFRDRAPRGADRTIEILRQVILLSPHPTFFGLLAEFYRDAGRSAETGWLTKLLDQTIAQEERHALAAPENAEVHLKLGALYLRRGYLDLAEHALSRAAELGLEPKESESLRQL